MTCDSEKQLANGFCADKQREALIYLPECDLLLCAEKQQQISSEDWARLSGSELDPLKTKALLARYRLLSCAELNTLDEFLCHLGVNEHPLFARLCLSEKLETYSRLNWVIKTYKISHKISHEVMQEAARFALLQAQSAPDFAARYQFYVCCTKKLRLETFVPSIRIARIALVQDAILLSLNEYSQVLPELATPPSAQDLVRYLSDWFGQGKHLGFSDAASGLWLTAQYLPLLAMSYVEITRAARDFVRHMQVFFKHHQATDAQLVQTGDRWLYEFNYPEVQARLKLNAEGCLSLDFYRLVCTELLRARLPQEDREFF